MNKKVQVAFLAVAFVAMLVPFVGMLWTSDDESASSENRALAEFPSFTNEDGSFNVNFIPEAGSYFEDHFAYRNALLSLNSNLRSNLLGSSSVDSVVVGTDGWLYYGGSLSDYLGQNSLSDRALSNIAHNLKLLQGYAQSRGSNFLFTVAPNKNSLYDENMPYYYLRTDVESNWTRLKPYLDECEVNYLDLFELLDGQDETLYYKTDTHWTNEGALLAANAMQDLLSGKQLQVDESLWTEERAYPGDLAKMLYPENPVTDLERYVSGVNDGEGMSGTTWSYREGSAVTDSEVATSGSGEGSLVMYRDSFGNALIPYLSTAYESAYYSKLIPYSALVIDEYQPSSVVVERAERHIAYLAEYAPIMGAPRVNLDTSLIGEGDDDALGASLTISQNGPYYVLQGVLDERQQTEDAAVYLAVEDASGSTQVYEAFDVSFNLPNSSIDTETTPSSASVINNGQQTDYGFTAYISSQDLDLSSYKVTVFTIADGTVLGSKTFDDLNAYITASN